MKRAALLVLVVAAAADASEIYRQDGQSRVFTNAPTTGGYESTGLTNEPKDPKRKPGPKRHAYVPRANTPLHEAAMRDDLEKLATLLDAGAAIDTPGEHGRTALMLAVMSGRTRAAALLLDRGAKANARRDDGGTALHDAASNSDKLEVARLLLGRGANPNARNERGLTPLHVASANTNRQNHNWRMIELLVKGGASPNIPNEWGQKALPDDVNPFLKPPPKD